MGWFKHAMAEGPLRGGKSDAFVDNYVQGLGEKESGKHKAHIAKRTASQSLAAPAGENTQPKSLGEPASPYRGGYTDSDGGDGLGSTPSGKRKRASQMLGG